MYIKAYRNQNFMVTYELISTDEKSVANKHCNDFVTKSKRKAMNRNWCNQKANPSLKFAVGIIES